MTGQAFVAQKKVKSEKYYNEIGGETRFRGEFGMTIISKFFDVFYPLIFHAHIHSCSLLILSARPAAQITLRTDS